MKVIIIYGTDCNETTAWIPWLNNELQRRSINVVIPNLPTPKNQTYMNWQNVVDKIRINEDDVIVSWSTGAIFSVRYLYEKKLQINKLICISGFNNYIGNVPEVDNINKDYFMQDISVARNIAKRIICIKSNNDPFISQQALSEFSEELDAKLINITNGGHFNSNAGYTKFEELLKQIF